jgi:hypothetical protein
MNPQEIYGTHIPAEHPIDDMRFRIHPKGHNLNLRFICGECGQVVVCIGVCLDHSRFAWYTGAELIRFKHGQYICPNC